MPPGIPADGLRKAAGNQALYLHLLALFNTHQAHVQPAQLQRGLGSLQAVADSLGLDGLAAAALQLQQAAQRQHGTGPAMARLQQAHAQALAHARSLLHLPTTSPPEDPATAAQAPALAQQLAVLLHDSDGDAIAFLHEHTDALRSLFAPGDFPRFQATVNRFDFEAGLHQLQAALARVAGA
jgi:hypothetical protein